MYVEGVAKVDEISDLKTYAIDDLREALQKNPHLDDAAEILPLLEQAYDSLSRDLANRVEPARDAVDEPIAPSTGDSA